MDPLTPEEARQQLRTVASGRHVPRRDLSLEEAKARLRAVDADLDIGPALGYLTQGRWREAGLSVVLWCTTDSGRAFLAPLLLRLLPVLHDLLGHRRSRRRDGANTRH